MSIAAIQWAFELELSDHTAKVVLLALADHYNDQSQCCWPSMPRLERYTGADKRTIQRAITRLEELGHVTREERPGSSSLFYLKMPKSEGMSHPRQSDAPPPSTRRGTPVKLTPHPRQDDAHNPYLTVNEPSLKASPALAPNGARSPASRAEWKRRLDNYDPSDIRKTWKANWGPRPDAPGHQPLIPRDILSSWLAQGEA